VGAPFRLRAGPPAHARRPPSEPDAELVFARELAAPPAAVFRTWTEPRLLARWWGPHGCSIPACELDPRPGGRLRILMAARDGTLFVCRGEFLAVQAPERLVFTATAEFGGAPMLLLLNEVALEPADGGTRLGLRSQVISAAPLAAALHASGMRLVWRESLERLDTVVEDAA
jgi:uncharacterized protein YndB with AHSA1/START domain